MELVLVLPILLMLLLGMFEFSLLFFARGDVVDASRAGARRAAMPGVSEQEVREDVLSSLPESLRMAAEVSVQGGAYTGDPVLVTVRVPMQAAAPDLLWPIGFGLQGRTLLSETWMVKE